MRGARELAVTVMGFASTVYSMIWAIEIELFPLYALLILPAAGFLVRLFMIQHDCAHRSFFPSRRANDCVGRLIGIATLTPHDHWRASHAFHHASSGDLDRRGIGDVITLTVAEYLARSPWGRLRYRLYRHPAVMFGIGPSFLFLLNNRFPMGFVKKGWQPWLSTMATNFGIAATLALLIATIGLRTFLWVYPPTLLIAAAAGVWLFYVQHQFEDTYWARGADWNARNAALYGSSHYHLPTVVRWFTANIGMHNVHHLSSRIPFYRLPEVLNDHRALAEVGRVTLLQSLRGVRLVLWDEERRRLVSLEQLRSPTRVDSNRVNASRGLAAGDDRVGERTRSGPAWAIHPSPRGQAPAVWRPDGQRRASAKPPLDLGEVEVLKGVASLSTRGADGAGHRHVHVPPRIPLYRADRRIISGCLVHPADECACR